MTISELMLQRQALLAQRTTLEAQIKATEDSTRDALASHYGITPGTHAQCFKRTLIVFSIDATFRDDTPRLYISGTDINDPEATYRYGWDPKHCRVIPENLTRTNTAQLKKSSPVRAYNTRVRGYK
jgi:hypothetical protein